MWDKFKGVCLKDICKIYDYVLFDSCGIISYAGEDFNYNLGLKLALSMKKSIKECENLFITQGILKEIRREGSEEVHFRKFFSVKRSLGNSFAENGRVLNLNNEERAQYHTHYNRYRKHPLFKGASDTDFNLFFYAFIFSRKHPSAMITNDSVLLGAWERFYLNSWINPLKFATFRRRDFDDYEMPLE